MNYCEEIISECKFKTVDPDDIKIPNTLRLDHERVAELKVLFNSTPDRTQTFTLTRLLSHVYSHTLAK